LKKEIKERKKNESGGGQGWPPSSTSHVEEVQQHSHSLAQAPSLWQHIATPSSRTHRGTPFTDRKYQGGTTIPHRLQFMFDTRMLKVVVNKL